MKLHYRLKSLDAVKVFDLTPKDSHKSFYGKARVELLKGGETVLYSYGTPVLLYSRGGALFRLWGGWSATTGRHIRAFCGMSKGEYTRLPALVLHEHGVAAGYEGAGVFSYE